ncbi:hypothetical protein NN561_014012 [Cricetulus griseus]
MLARGCCARYRPEPRGPGLERRGRPDAASRLLSHSSSRESASQATSRLPAARGQVSSRSPTTLLRGEARSGRLAPPLLVLSYREITGRSLLTSP